MTNLIKRIPKLLLVLVLSTAVLSACTAAAAQNPTPILDERLYGQWSDQADAIAVDLNEAGEPVGAVAIGTWFVFHEDGSYERVANYMTFAIGGVAVEEGRYAVDGNKLVLTNRTDSFFPFEGSPQKRHYRTAVADGSLTFRFGTEDGKAVLFLADLNSNEVLFHSVK